jgi:hypothetical protein
VAEHELKTHPEPFGALIRKEKPYEVRRADRPFQVNDTLRLREFDPIAEKYTGRSALAVITYITPPGRYGLPPDLTVLGISFVRTWWAKP